MTTLDDDDLPVVDDTTADPLWFRYCVCTKGTSDKFYELSIDVNDKGEVVLTRRYGRRPDYLNNGQTRVDTFAAFPAAKRKALDLYSEKIGKGGYVPTPRGF